MRQRGINYKDKRKRYKTKKDKIRIGVILGMLLMVLSGVAKDYSPKELVNPNLADRRVYVADPGNLVSSDIKARVNAGLWNLRQQTGAEVVVAVVPSIGDTPIEDFSTELFEQWGIGTVSYKHHPAHETLMNTVWEIKL